MGRKNFIYTIWPHQFEGFDNNIVFTQTLVAFLNALIGHGIQHYTCQLEEGEEEHRPHIQLFVQYEKESRGDRIERLLGIGKHQYSGVQQRFGTADDMRDYCAKEDGRLFGPFEQGEFSGDRQGARSDLERLARRVARGDDLRSIAIDDPLIMLKYGKHAQALRELIDEPSWEPIAGREVIVLEGPPGAGKTHWVAEFVKEHGPGYKCPINFDGKAFWLNGYRGQPTALIDDFDGAVPIGALKRLLHDWEERAPIKGGFTTWRPKYIIITTNHPWQTWYPTLVPGSEDYGALERRITRVIRFNADERVTLNSPVPRSVSGGDNISSPPLLFPLPADDMDLDTLLDM